MPDDLLLGAYRLLGPAPVQRGGMGAVWHGRHVRTGEPVAIKLIASDPVARGGSTAELALIARLDHPAIIQVLDVGQVDAQAAATSDGRLYEGQPYLVMELADGGTLSALVREGPSWPAVREILLQVLAALAHAHAHEVLHLDLKPDNVLIVAASDGPTRYRLADFSVAVHARAADHPTPVGGTVGFMAPEQLDRSLGPLGPWTDLYGLGTLAYALLNGSPPPPGLIHGPSLFHGNSPRVPVPPAAFAWLQRLTASSPERRYRNARHALSALQLTPATVDPPRLPSVRRPAAGDSTQTSASPARPATTLPDPDCHLPADWRRPPAARRQLAHPSLALRALRSPPLEGREVEQDRLWARLHQVASDRRAAAVVLCGPEGSGRRALARWLARTAAELGGCEAVYLASGRSLSGAEPLVGWLERLLGVTTVEGAERAPRIERALDALGVDDLYERDIVRWMLGHPLGPEPTPQERHAVLRHCLARIAGGAPIVAVLEDPDGDPRTHAFLRAHLDRADGPAVLWVLISKDAEGPAVPEASTVLQLDPISDLAMARLLRDGLGLRGELALRVRQTALGRPGRAVHLAEIWLREAALVEVDGGLDLAPDTPIAPPASLTAAWERRLLRALVTAEEADWDALAVAAAWGPGVPDHVWSALCAALHLRPADDLRGRLLDAGLAVSDQGGWRFVDPLLWQAARQLVAPRPLWARAHLACANWRRTRAGRAVDFDLIAGHLYEAAAAHEAVLAAHEAARRHLQASDYTSAHASLSLARRALPQVAADDQPALTWAHERLTLRVLHGQGPAGRAAQLAEVMIARALSTLAHDQLATPLRFRAMELRKSDPTLAEALLAWAGEEAQRHGDQQECARALQHRAGIAASRGGLARARSMAKAAVALFEQIGDAHGAADAAVELATMEFTSGGDLDAAEQIAEGARQTYLSMGNRFGTSRCSNLLADLLRQRGALDEAEAAYRESLRIAMAIDSKQRSVPLINLALLALDRGEPSRDALESAMAVARRDGADSVPAYASAALLICTAREADWAAWESHAAYLEARGQGGPRPDRELADLLARAADEAGSPERARRLTVLGALWKAPTADPHPISATS